MTTDIETYLNSLYEDILTLNVSNRSIKSLPNLTKFKNLQKLICSNNELTIIYLYFIYTFIINFN